MKPISMTRETGRWAQALARIAILATCCFSMNLLLPAQADTGIGADTDISTGSENISSINDCPSPKIRDRYFDRFPFAKDIDKSDELEPVQGSPQDKSSGSTPRLQQAKDSTSPQTGPSPALMLVVGNQSNGGYSQPLVPEIQNVKTKKDEAIFHNLCSTKGLPLTDTNFQVLHRENGQRFLEMYFDPERTMWQNSNQAQLQGASASNSFAGAATTGFGAAVNGIQGGYQAAGGAGGGAGGSSAMGALINIANENAGTPTLSDAQFKPISGAVWMVQQMYKFVFVPMAILFLLPGAVLTQVKGQVASGILGQQSPSPFEGILRAMIAVFLIPATQLIMSYAIDVGNSLTYSVNDYVDTSVIQSWTQQTIYDVPVPNVDNSIVPPSGSGSGSGGNSGGAGASSSGAGGGGVAGAADAFINSSLNSALGSTLGGAVASLITPGLNSAINGFLGGILGSLNPFSFGAGGDGLSVNTPDSKAIQERQLWTSQTMELVLNAAIYFFSMAVLILGAYQLVFMCYLYLLGPLAAAFFAWPVIGGSQSAPNSNVFSGWVDAVIVVSLWRFYWMVILAIMTQRILWMMDTGQKLNLQWEVTVFICLLGLMLYVPFHPWDYDPGKAFTQAMAAGQQLAQAAGPGMGAAAQQAGVPQGQIDSVGKAFNQVGHDSGPILNNQAGANNEAARGQATGNSGSPVGGPLALMQGSGPPGESGSPSQSGPVASNAAAPAAPPSHPTEVANNAQPNPTGPGPQTEVANANTSKEDQDKSHSDQAPQREFAMNQEQSSPPGESRSSNSTETATRESGGGGERVASADPPPPPPGAAPMTVAMNEAPPNPTQSNPSSPSNPQGPPPGVNDSGTMNT